MKKLSPGSWLVFSNGTLTHINPYEPVIFDSYGSALEYIDGELDVYGSGIDYYMCRVEEYHHATIQKHKRRIV